MYSGIIPVNNHCTSPTNTKIVTEVGTGTHQATTGIDSANNQHITNAQFDSIDTSSIKKLYGGNTMGFFIKWNHKIENIPHAKNEKEAIHLFLKGHVLKKNSLLEIRHTKAQNATLYHVNKNKTFKMLYDGGTHPQRGSAGAQRSTM